MPRFVLNPEIFSRTVEDVITPSELTTRLARRGRLRIKLGIDATSPDLHIGHALILWKIRALQEAGHTAVIILGDFTTRIGDPTGKTKARPVLAPVEIQKNIRSIRAQVEKILLADRDYLEIRRNSEWHGRMRSRELLQLLSRVTHARLIERDMFQERIRSGGEIFMHELLYPILQGYDSVAIRSDLTIVGSDQLFNEHLGRFFQEKFDQPPQVIVTVKLLPGLDGGAQMSKSAGDYISVRDSVSDMFGKIMRLVDPLILPYLEAYTAVPMSEIRAWRKRLDEGENPREAKMFLAQSLTARYHGAAAARRERERFLSVFSQKTIPRDARTVRMDTKRIGILDLLVQIALAPSRSQARRLVEGGAVEIDGGIIRDPRHVIEVRSGTILRVGKHRFVRMEPRGK